MAVKTNKGEDLDQLSTEQPLMLIFLRHFGCTFCRESMTEIHKVRKLVESQGVKIVLVHMVHSRLADQILSLYELNDLSHISDPDKLLYKQFGLNRAKWREIFNYRVIWRTLVAGIFKGHLAGKPIGDPYQMPGVFVYHNQAIVRKFTYNLVSDHPDYLQLATNLA